MGKFIDFNTLADQVAFKEVLDWLEIPYTEKNGKLIGNGFSVDIKANRYKGSADNYGNIINFVACVKKCDLRKAAEMIDEQFLSGKQVSVDDALDRFGDDAGCSRKDEPQRSAKPKNRELSVIDEQGVIVRKFIFEQHA